MKFRFIKVIARNTVHVNFTLNITKENCKNFIVEDIDYQINKKKFTNGKLNLETGILHFSESQEFIDYLTIPVEKRKTKILTEIKLPQTIYKEIVREVGTINSKFKKFFDSWSNVISQIKF